MQAARPMACVAFHSSTSKAKLWMLPRLLLHCVSSDSPPHLTSQAHTTHSKMYLRVVAQSLLGRPIQNSIAQRQLMTRGLLIDGTVLLISQVCSRHTSLAPSAHSCKNASRHCTR